MSIHTHHSSSTSLTSTKKVFLLTRFLNVSGLWQNLVYVVHGQGEHWNDLHSQVLRPTFTEVTLGVNIVGTQSRLPTHLFCIYLITTSQIHSVVSIPTHDILAGGDQKRISVVELLNEVLWADEGPVCGQEDLTVQHQIWKGAEENTTPLVHPFKSPPQIIWGWQLTMDRSSQL